MPTHASSLMRSSPDADRRLGAYRVVGSLGRGASAQVFKAEHRHLGQLRALKVLRAKNAGRAETIARLVTEARAMARVRHPSIAEVFECDVLDDGTAFIAMEYLRGEPLHLWLEREGKLHKHPLLAAAMAGTLAEALEVAHEHSIVHRDLKPENVLLVANPGRAGAFFLKLLDFGIAKLLREEPLTRTAAGCVIGTPRSMAPEQWQPNGVIDARADIYALGCLLFELLCGRAVFEEINERAMMRAHLHDPPPSPASLVPGVPPALDLLIGRMLAKSPDGRPQSMAEVIDALAALIGHRRFGELLRLPAGWSLESRQTVDVEPTPFPPRLASFGAWTVKVALLARRVRRSLVGLAVLGAALVAGGVWMTSRSQGSGARPQASPPVVARPAPASTQQAEKASPPVVSRPAAAPTPEAEKASPPVVSRPDPTRSEPAEKARVAPAPQVARITATPLPARQPLSERFSVRISSVPAGVETWVEGEGASRGRTPIDLTFPTDAPRAAAAGDGARGHSTNVYQKVGD